MDLGLTGRRVIVTGGSRGIGEAVIRTLVTEGASVVTCARNGEALEATLAAIRADHPGATVSGDAVDVTDGPAFEAWVAAAIERLGGLDSLILNASVQPSGDDDATWQLTFASDVLQAVRALRVARTALADSDAGSVVVVSSTAALSQSTPPIQIAYGSVKAALISFASKMAAQLGPEGTRVNTVIPGPIEFPGGSWDQMRIAMPPVYEGVSKLSVLGRLGQAAEAANAITFLASPAASYITGVSLRVDGGVVKTVDF